MNASDIVVFADESMNAARKEMLGIFVSFYNEGDNAFHLDFINLVECSSTDSESLLDLLNSTLDSQNVDIHRTRFCCLDGTNAMSGEHTDLQRRIQHLAHSIYLNCRCHRLSLCFKHLMEQFAWISSIDSLLLGLWKVFHYIGKNRHIVKELQEAYGMKALYTVKASITRWLSHGTACKRCRERYTVFVEALDNILIVKPNPETSGYRDTLLSPITLMQITMLEDVLSVTNALSVLLQSDRKEFSEIQRGLKHTVDSLASMRDDENNINLVSFSKSTEIIERLEEYKREKMMSSNTRKRSKMDIKLPVSNFHCTGIRPFLDARIGEIKAAFDLSDLPIIESLLCLDSNSMSEATDGALTSYGNSAMEVLFNFYGKSQKKIFEGRVICSESLFSMTAMQESLVLEYGGYKAYVTKQKDEKTRELNANKRTLSAKLLLEEAKKYNRKRDTKQLKSLIKEVEQKISYPLTMEDLLADKVVGAAFPTVCRLLKICILLPQSEAGVERRFLKMKLPMTKQRTSLDSKSLDALM